MEEHQLLGSIGSKEIVNKTELKKLDMNDPVLSLNTLNNNLNVRAGLSVYLVIRNESILHLGLPQCHGIRQPADQVLVSGIQRPSSLLLHGFCLLCYLSPCLIGHQHHPFARYLDTT